jgi:cobalt-zinc-cadmium efflux system membrane fusion protein
LLRPGLLADVEIIVEKVTNAIYIPNQSLFEKDGKPVVYVKRGEKFEPQVVQIAKRSEALTILSGGINPGDTIALSDPFEKPGEKKQAEEKKGSAGPMGAMPSSKGGQ